MSSFFCSQPRAWNQLLQKGFLGLDNISVFDRSASIPGGKKLEQSDGTSWMAFFCMLMLKMVSMLCSSLFLSIICTQSMELADQERSYEDIASKFFEVERFLRFSTLCLTFSKHFVSISDAINAFRGTGLWDAETEFYYDVLRSPEGSTEFLRVRFVDCPLFFVLFSLYGQKALLLGLCQ